MRLKQKRAFPSGGSQSLQFERIMVVVVIFLLLGIGIFGQLVNVQILHHKRYSEYALDQYKRQREIPPLRGSIYDRNGKRLACSLTNYVSIGLHLKVIKDKTKLRETLAQILNLSKKTIEDRFKVDDKFVWLVQRVRVSHEQMTSLRKLNPQEVTLQNDVVREYPFRQVGAQVLGYVGHNNLGACGIEGIFEQVMKGKPGFEIVQVDALECEIHDTNSPGEAAIDGADVHLALDIIIQSIAEEELSNAVETNNAAGGMVVVTKPKSGRILALASYPGFDSNKYSKYSDFARKNRAICDEFEPGSTLKIIPFTGLVETEKAHLQQLVYCENGRFKVQDRYITDYHPYQYLTMQDVLAKSSNIGTVKLSFNLKPEEMFITLRDYGFGQSTGILLTGETSGKVPSSSEWSKVRQASIAYGYSCTVTALQLAMAYGAIANGGWLMKPILVDKLVYQDGKTWQAAPEKVRRVMKPLTARVLNGMLTEVVNTGTGKNAQLPLYQVAGKTGTAKMYDNIRKIYYEDKYRSSFIGYFPSEDPEYLAVIVIEDPRTGYYGGSVAAPVWRAIMERLLANSSIFNTDFLPRLDAARYADQCPPDEGVVIPNFVNLSAEEAKNLACCANLKFVLEGKGKIVVRQDVQPGVMLKRGEAIKLSLGLEEPLDGRLKVPDVRGLTVREAVRKLSQSGIQAQISGDGCIVEQFPPPGQQVQVGKLCHLVAKNNGNRSSS